MNKRVRWFLLVAIIFGGALWLSGSLVAVEKPAGNGRVVIDKGHIVLTGTELSKADQEAMNKVLGHYNKALYRIDAYEKGMRKKTQGSLTNVVTDKHLASEIASNIKKAGFTHFAVQVCTGSTTNPLQSLNPSPKPGATTNPARSDAGNITNPLSGPNSASSANPDPKCPELVERLKPILEKYRRK